MYFYLCSKHFYLLLYQQEAISRRLSDATTEQYSTDDSSVDERPKPRKIDSTSVKVKTVVPKIELHDPKWTDGSIPLDALSDKLSKIGRVSNMHSSLSANYLHLLLLT